MNDGKFQWDDAKAASNIADHGVTFDAAREAFADPFALDWLDEVRIMAKTVTPWSAWRRVACSTGLHDQRRNDPHHFGEISRAPGTKEIP